MEGVLQEPRQGDIQTRRRLHTAGNHHIVVHRRGYLHPDDHQHRVAADSEIFHGPRHPRDPDSGIFINDDVSDSGR